MKSETKLTHFRGEDFFFLFLLFGAPRPSELCAPPYSSSTGQGAGD